MAFAGHLAACGGPSSEPVRIPEHGGGVELGKTEELPEGALFLAVRGVGVVELGMTAGLVAAGGAETDVVAAVLVYRALTYLPPIPIGAVCYLAWRRHLGRAEPAAPRQDAVTA